MCTYFTRPAELVARVHVASAYYLCILHAVGNDGIVFVYIRVSMWIIRYKGQMLMYLSLMLTHAGYRKPFKGLCFVGECKSEGGVLFLLWLLWLMVALGLLFKIAFEILAKMCQAYGFL